MVRVCRRVKRGGRHRMTARQEVLHRCQKSHPSPLCAPEPFATCSRAGAIRRLPRCGRGGIGRRAALRSLWGNPWKFESSRPHQQNRLRPVFLCLPSDDLRAFEACFPSSVLFFHRHLSDGFEDCLKFAWYSDHHAAFVRHRRSFGRPPD